MENFKAFLRTTISQRFHDIQDKDCKLAVVWCSEDFAKTFQVDVASESEGQQLVDLLTTIGFYASMEELTQGR